MSPGSAAIPLLKAAPEPDQIADRLADGPIRGLELCLAPHHVADDTALRAAVEVCDELTSQDLEITAEAPVSWPSGAFVSVDRLDDEARSGIERSADFARAVGSPVLTIHLFIPLAPEEFRAAGGVDEAAVERFLGFYADTCASRGVEPLIENVPPILRMRTGGIYLSRIGGHWRDLLGWRRRVPELGFTLDVSHAALFRSFADAYPGLFEVEDPSELTPERYVGELGPASRVAHVSNAAGLLGEGLPYRSGELELDPVVRRLGDQVPWIVAEINEPDPARASEMKHAYAAIESALESDGGIAPKPPRAPVPAVRGFDWQALLGTRDPVPSVLELQELFGGRRVLVTGGGGSIAGALATFVLGFRPERIALLDSHEPSLAADRRSRDPAILQRFAHLLGDVRREDRLNAILAAERPDVVFHLAAYKHVDWAERFPEEFVDTNLRGSWNLLRAAELAEVETVVVASTDKAAMASSRYARTKRLMEQMTALAGGGRIAVRFVNVLGSAGSASQLFLRQARDGLPMTVTDSGMVRYWITMGHAACLAAHGALLGRTQTRLAAPADPVTLTVGELATRIWRHAGRQDEPDVTTIGIRSGETMTEVLTGEGEEIEDELHQGIAPIRGGPGTSAAEWVTERLAAAAGAQEADAIWLEALGRPDLLPAAASIPSDGTPNRAHR
jgi:nucleoside-diphosphate-sugar epimerase/sugar phosphate isomerase/epimerase